VLLDKLEFYFCLKNGFSGLTAQKLVQRKILWFTDVEKMSAEERVEMYEG